MCLSLIYSSFHDPLIHFDFKQFTPDVEGKNQALNHHRYFRLRVTVGTLKLSMMDTLIAFLLLNLSHNTINDNYYERSFELSIHLSCILHQATFSLKNQSFIVLYC